MNVFTCVVEISKLAASADVSIYQNIFKNFSLKKYIFKIAFLKKNEPHIFNLFFI